MCGIIAYKGERNAFPILVKGLKRLEYRGYDSFGILTLKDDFDFEKRVGAVTNTRIRKLREANIGMGHTRWATHGGVTETNAHPHFSCNKEFAVVHNGVIENIDEIKPIIKGHKIMSQTDTELIVHLVEEFAKNRDTLSAVMKAAGIIKGRNSFVIADKKSKELFAVRKGSPLIIGVKDKEYFAASDINAISGFADKVIFLEDNEMAVFNSKLDFYDITNGRKLYKKTQVVSAVLNEPRREKYEHYMLKEIIEQKETLRKAIIQEKESLLSFSDKIFSSSRLFLVGCGSAHKVCLAASYLFMKKIQAFAIVASEFSSYLDLVDENSVVLAVSQSGETADTLEALEMAKSKGAKCLAIVNMEGSTMCRQYESLITHSGSEIAVASTKATTAQFALLSYISGVKQDDIIELEDNIAKLLDEDYLIKIKKIAETIIKNKINNIYVIGRGINYATALEAGIKLQEVSYINALCFSGGELKHGPLALIKKGSLCIVIGNDINIITNAIEAKARGAKIVGVSCEENKVFDIHIRAPESAEELQFIANIIPIQVLAYYISILKGINPDKPRNLAKSVTVK